MVEFALILFPLLLLVVGIIQFGIGLNFWLDEQRLANQGARWAVVNGWPGCPRPADSSVATTCTSGTVSCVANPPTNVTLQRLLYCNALSQGLKHTLKVEICYPATGDINVAPGTVGAPVRVKIDAPFKFMPFLGIGTITLTSRATM